MSEIKVNTYTIQIRNKNSKKTGDNFLEFGKFHEDESELSAKTVLEEFIKTFDLKFRGLKSENKAMKIENDFTYKSIENSISGFFKAGFTGEEKEIYERDTINGESIFTVDSDHVSTSEYYFKIWLPKKRATGLLLVQGTSSESAGDLFKHLFHKLLNDFLENKIVKISRFISKEAVDKFISSSGIERIVLTKNRYPKDKANDLLGQEILTTDARVKLIFEGASMVKDKVIDLIQNKGISLGIDGKFFTSESLESIEFGADDEYDTSISFRDKKNKKSATAKSNNGFEIKPFTYIDKSKIVRDERTNKPTRESISRAVTEYFEEIKPEIL